MSVGTAAFQRERNSTSGKGPPPPLRAPSQCPVSSVHACTLRPGRTVATLEGPVLRHSPGASALLGACTHPQGCFLALSRKVLVSQRLRSRLSASRCQDATCVSRTCVGRCAVCHFPPCPASSPLTVPAPWAFFPPYPLQQRGLCASKLPLGLVLMPCHVWVCKKHRRGEMTGCSPARGSLLTCYLPSHRPATGQNPSPDSKGPRETKGPLRGNKTPGGVSEQNPPLGPVILPRHSDTSPKRPSPPPSCVSPWPCKGQPCKAQDFTLEVPASLPAVSAGHCSVHGLRNFCPCRLPPHHSPCPCPVPVPSPALRRSSTHVCVEDCFSSLYPLTLVLIVPCGGPQTLGIIHGLVPLTQNDWVTVFG